MAWTNNGTGWIKTSEENGISILFAANGMKVVRLRENVVTYKKRGTNAENADTPTDSTTQTTYYAHQNGQTYTFTATTSSKTDYSAIRADPSGQWEHIKRVTTYSVVWPTWSAGETNPWGTTPLDENGNEITLDTSGRESTVSYDKSFTDVHGVNTHRVLQSTATLVKEIKYISTLVAATNIVNANTSDTTGYTNLYFHTYIDNNGTHTPITAGWCSVTTGVSKYATARFVSDQDGWTVTVTEITRGWGQSNQTSEIYWATS